MNAKPRRRLHRSLCPPLPSLLPLLPLILACPLLALAHDGADAALPAIAVTADKTTQEIEAVSTSLTVLDGLELEQAGTDGLAALEGRVPGLAFQPFGQAGLNAPVMRGLSANFNALSTSVLLLVDGVPVHTAQGFEDALLDVERIEVLRGPQSTLYGRNAQAGVMAIHSRPLDGTPRASASTTAGQRGQRGLRFSISRPLLADTLVASLSGSWQQQDGFIRNTHSGAREDGRQRRTLKFGLRWTPTAATDITLRHTGQAYDDGAALWGAPTQPRARVASGADSWNRSRGQGLALHATHALASGLRLQSITAWSRFHDDVQQDTDFTPSDLLHIRRDHHLRTRSQELRLNGNWRGMDWLGGLYADWHDHDLHNTGRRMAARDDLRTGQKSRTAALFVHGTRPLSQDWSLTGGARLERSRVHIAPLRAARQHQGASHLSPRLALQYRFAPQHQWYASASRGIRSGGFNTLSPASGYAAFAPEKVWSVESGIKGLAAHDRLRHSLSAYFMDIKNMQVLQMPIPGLAYITSAAAATSRGLEMEAEYLLRRHWTLQAGLAFNRTRFARFVDGAANYRGRRNPFAPDWNGHAALHYDSSTWYARAQWRASSKVWLDAANRYRRHGHGLPDVVAGRQHGSLDWSVYANNITNKKWDAVGYQNGFVTVYSPPRQWGLRLTWRM